MVARSEVKGKGKIIVLNVMKFQLLSYIRSSYINFSYIRSPEHLFKSK